MSIFDYQHPDIVFGEQPIELGLDRHHNPIFRLRSGRCFVVYARPGNNRAVFAPYGGHVWKCRACEYYPGVNEAPPIPGQHCLSCGILLAEWQP